MTRDAMLFVDQENLRNGANKYDSEFEYDFEKLRDELCNNYYIVRSYWFASWHPNFDRPSGFYRALERSGYRVVDAPRVERNGTYIEKEVDITLATEMLAHAFQDNYDTAVLVSGDRDYRRVIEYTQDRGKRVVAAGWQNSTSEQIKDQADQFVSLDDIAGDIEK